MYMMNRDFTPKQISMILEQFAAVRGRWHGAAVWETQGHLDAFRRGENVDCLALPDFANGITDEGIHYLLEVGFRSDAGSPVAQIAPWYAGLIDNAGFTGVDPSDTMASHSGWTESTDYSESVRQTFVFGAAATRAITAQISFSINATKTIQGVFVTSVSTKGGSTGTLWSTAEFSSPPSLISGNVLTANYSLSD
jgi:hypothetical protein